MSKRALILVEGQTEERFVKDVLAPAFWDQGLFLIPTLLVTKRVKDGPHFKGGVTSFSRFENDAMRLLNSAGGALVTTLLDYYGLPADFPGMSSRPPNATARVRVLHVQTAMLQHFGSPPGFLPFLALHEFEAWLFSDCEILPKVLTTAQSGAAFAAIRAGVQTPEEINERPHSAPSKRIQSLFPSYQKTVHGPLATKRIGLEKIRSECPHFDHWLKQMEEFAAK